MIYAQDKGSCISDVVFQSRDTLHRVEKFIYEAAQQANQKKFQDKDYMVDQASSYQAM